MRNIVLYINNADFLDYAISYAQADDIDANGLVVVFQLSELSKEVVPLIGDLRELRAMKYARLINERYQERAIKVKEFKPVVFQSDFSLADLKEILAKDGQTDFYNFGKPGNKIMNYLDKLAQNYSIVINEIDEDSALKAGE